MIVKKLISLNSLYRFERNFTSFNFGMPKLFLIAEFSGDNEKN